jgi:hypothetical protein
MSVKLPLFDLYNPLSKAIVSDLKAALYQFGAFRLVVPETTRHRHDAIIENASLVHLPVIVFVTN